MKTKEKVALFVIVGLFAAVAAAGGLLVVREVSHKTKNPTTPKQHVTAPKPTRLPASQAGLLFRQVYNRLPPLTKQITHVGRCFANPNNVNVYACAFKFNTGKCIAIEFSAVPAGDGRYTMTSTPSKPVEVGPVNCA